MLAQEQQIELRLSLLYAISLFGQAAAISRLKQLFFSALAFDEVSWQALLGNISDSDLINRVEDRLIISDNGMVALSFFQDRIPQATIDALDQAAALENSLSNYEWQMWYDERHQIFQLMQLKDHQRILGLQLAMTPQEAAQFAELELPDGESLLEALKQFILTYRKQG